MRSFFKAKDNYKSFVKIQKWKEAKHKKCPDQRDYVSFWLEHFARLTIQVE
jgi:hypothetical protein